MTRLTAVLGTLSISFTAIIFRLADVSSATGAFFRTFYALPLLLLLVRSTGPERRPPRARWMAFGSGILWGLDLVLWHAAIQAIGAGLATVLVNTQVVFVGLAAWVFHRERPTPVALALIPAVFAGVVAISGLGRPGAYGADPVLGIALGVVAGLCYAGFLLVIRASNRRLAPTPGPLLDATAGAATVSLAAGAFDPSFSLSVSWPAHGWLAALAVVGQILGWMLLTRALPRLPALETSVLLLLQPMATVLWALLIFRESLSVIQWGGVALVLGGVAALSTLGSVRPAVRQPPAP